MISKTFKLLTLSVAATAMSGCAFQSSQVESISAPVSIDDQQNAQQRITTQQTKPILKRKVALGRISNETIYGKSLLLSSENDALGKQVTDMLSKALTESNQYMVFERPDIKSLQNEARITGKELSVVGVDTLIIGSLTEFGRKTIGRSGFLSETKKQIAHAKVDLRLVNTSNGLVYFSCSGAGEASLESGSQFWGGSHASYDGTINDQAISNAVSKAVEQLTKQIQTKPWKADILSVSKNIIFLSAGQSQGITKGMFFSVQTKGEKIKSSNTGFTISLPGKEVATVRIEDFFGESATDQGSIAKLSSGSLKGYSLKDLIVVEKNK